MNKNVFKRQSRMAANTVNEAGGKAYSMALKEALAQLAMTGCISDTFYVSAENQLEKIIELCTKSEPMFIAQCAAYSRTKGYMKDMPALLLACLASKKDQSVLLSKVFPKVINNGKMLQNYVQTIRSGVTGRKSFGTTSKRLIQNWFTNRTDDEIFKNSIGNEPSFGDIIKMVHPKPEDKSRAALFAYLAGREYDGRLLKGLTREFESFKGKREKDKTTPVPEVPFLMLTHLSLSESDWKDIAKTMSWHSLRMNLNTLGRHGVFSDKKLVVDLAKKLADPETIRKVKVFPYQILTTFDNLAGDVPRDFEHALQDALEVSLENVPAFAGKQIVVCPDVSGSMGSPVTGSRGKAPPSKTKCVDIAALVASVFLRKNKDTVILPFEQRIVNIKLNARDSVMTNAKILAKFNGGGTDCSLPLKLMNQKEIKADVVVFVSDNESWLGRDTPYSTAMAAEWKIYKKANPQAKLVCLDIQPNTSVQVPGEKDVLNIGGFSDTVFTVISSFIEGSHGKDLWVKEIERIVI